MLQNHNFTSILSSHHTVPTSSAVQQVLCPPTWGSTHLGGNNYAIDDVDCNNLNSVHGNSVGNVDVNVIGTSASLIARAAGDVVGDGNYTLPPDNLLDFELDPLERVVSAIVPAFFGVIGVAGLLGNALVIFGE